VAAFNALVVPLAIERQAYIAPRSQGIFEYEPELEAIVAAGAAADKTIYYLEKEYRAALKKADVSDDDIASATTAKITNPRYDIDRLLNMVPCVAANNCTGPLSSEILAGLQHRQKSGAWLGETLSSYFASYLSSSGVENSGSSREYAGPLLVPTHWAVRLLYDLNNDESTSAVPAVVRREGSSSSIKRKEALEIDPVRLATLLFDLSSATNSNSSSDSGGGVEKEVGDPHDADHDHHNEQEQQHQSELSALLQTGMDALDSLWATASAATLAKLDFSFKRQQTEVERMREAYLNKIATVAAKSGASSPPPPAQVLPRLYRNMHKHVIEMRRMEDEDHRALVPLVESALAIMRLSCERWFALIGVYLGYLLFRDPPPAARAVIRFVARVSRFFQRAILLSFPAVCWVYGAGIVFSSFASVIFWAGPVIRGLEHLRSATASVAPREWHDATPAEFERMGGLCAICWGDLETSSGGGSTDGNGNGTATGTAEGGVEPTPTPTDAATAQQIRAAGLSCGHAYHRKCIVGWLQSCYGQGRTPTCPMCQTEVPIRIKYRLPLTANATEVEAEAGGDAAAGGNNNGDAGDGGAGGDAGGGGLHRREPGIPGLDMLVDALPEEFRHRFEPPMGLAHVENNNNNQDVAAAPAPAAAPPVEQPLFPAGNQDGAYQVPIDRMHPDIQVMLREAIQAAQAAAADQHGGEPRQEEQGGGGEEEQRQPRQFGFRFRFFNRQGARQLPPL
jgi:hypothetical protein